MGRSMAGGESRGTVTQNSTRENVKTCLGILDSSLQRRRHRLVPPPAGQNGSALSLSHLPTVFDNVMFAPKAIRHHVLWKVRSQWNQGATRPDTSSRGSPKGPSTGDVTELTVRGAQRYGTPPTISSDVRLMIAS